MTVVDDNPPIFLPLRVAAPNAVLNDLNYGIANAPLPVSLVSFEASKTMKGNELVWKTSNEINFSHFEVERSVDTKAFSQIGKVLSSNSKENSGYNYIDESVFGQLYYRLKLVDLDGSFNYSKIIFVNNDPVNDLVGNFYPNPTIGNEVNINIIATIESKVTISAIDISGKLINSKVENVQKGENLINVKIPQSTKGALIYKIEVGDKTYFRRLNN